MDKIQINNVMHETHIFQAWCSTEVDSRGNHVGGQGKWGNCGPTCPK